MRRSSYAFAFLDTPLSLYITLECISKKCKSHSPQDVKFLVAESDRFIKGLVGRFLGSCEVDYCSKLSLYHVIELIFWSYRNNLKFVFLSDIGIKNKLLITLLKCNCVYIVDDGLHSLARRREEYSRMAFFSKWLTFFCRSKTISYYSIYTEAYSGQCGEFNNSIENLFEAAGTFVNKMFYICSCPTLDGMTFDNDDILTEKLINYAKSLNKELAILPHRRDNYKVSSKYKYRKHILQVDEAFEEFYYLNTFFGCHFITLYSGAILAVSKKDNPGYLMNYFSPKIEQTFFSKLLGQPIIRNEEINAMFDSAGVDRVILN